MAGQGPRDEPRAEFDRFYENYFPRVYGLMRKHRSDRRAAEEATRAVFVELVDRLDGLSDRELETKLIEVVRRQLRGRQGPQTSSKMRP